MKPFTATGCPGTEKRARRQGSRRRRFLLVVASLLIVPAPFLITAHAQALSVQAAVDKTEATVEDQIVLTVSVIGERSLPDQPELPPLPDFNVAQGGTSSRTQLLNGRISSSVEFNYFLSPRSVGSFTIGPIRVRKKGQIEQSQPIQIRILPTQAAAGEVLPAFVEQKVDVERPYVNQQIVFAFRFLRRVQAVEAQWDPPAFQGFWVEDMGKERQYQQALGGQNYLVTEIKKALYPLAAGTLEIPGNSLTCKLVMQRRRSRGLDSFFDNNFLQSPFLAGGDAVTKVLQTDPVRVQVRPLPEGGRPTDFSGLVGAFSIQAEVGQERLQVGDSTTLTLTVKGRGNLRDLAELPPQELQGFKIYPDKPTLQMQPEGEVIQGEKVFKKALVPLAEGDLEIPSVELSYFDPEEGAFRTARTGPILLSVEGKAESEQLHLVQPSGAAGSGTAIQLLGKDILPIHTGLAGARRQIPAKNRLWLYLLGLVAPPGAVLTCYGLKRKRERLEVDTHLVRRKEAGRKAKKELHEAKKRLSLPGNPEFYGQISRSLRGLVGDKLNLSALAFTPAEVYRCLAGRGIETEAARSVQQFLEELESLQFGSTREEARDRENRFKKAGAILKMLDKRL